MPNLTIEIDEDVFLPVYKHLLYSDSDINFLWGGRDSGKSVFISQKLLLDCLQSKYFRCILVRKVYEDIKDSQWQLIKDWAERWGIDDYFIFNKSPLEIICKLNGNKFIARGCDKPTKIKSVANPSHVWYEEGNQLKEADYITISTSLRSNETKVQEWFSFNPECEDDYEDFWLYNQYFKNHFEKGTYSFTNTIKSSIDAWNAKKKTYTKQEVSIKYNSVHTTYHNNPYCSPERIARHEALKDTNPYYYLVFTKGLWGRRQSGGEAYKCYVPTKHIGMIKYNADLPLHLTFDFNVNPYMSASVWQVDGKKADKINEIILSHPRNTTLAVCSEFERIYPGHEAGLFIYGDPSGLKQSTAAETTVRVKEKDYSEYTRILSALKKYHPSLRVSRVYPPVTSRINFINTIFESNFSGIHIMFDESCKRTHAEYSNLKEASDGTKHKEKYKDEVTGVTCEKWGHISDGDDYFLTYCFATEFAEYQRGGKNTEIRTYKQPPSRHSY